MTKFTDEQIIKALECCSTDVRENPCPKCAFYNKHRCSTLMVNAVSDLISRYKAKNESLKQIINEQDKEILKLQNRIIFWRKNLNYQPEKIKSEAIKDFAERLKERLTRLSVRTKTHGRKTTPTYVDDIANQILHDVVPQEIDSSVKEMTEVQE